MPLNIIHYPHPTLRHVSKPLKRVDAELRGMAAEMLELMYAAHGIGLAANQVDLPYRMFVCNPSGERENSDQEFVFINPVVRKRSGMDEAEEGCLSLPGVYGKVRRPAAVAFEAFTLAGEKFERELDGLFGRMVQHEIDHLDGVLFIDRLSKTAKIDVRDKLAEFEQEFESRLRSGEPLADADVAARLGSLEAART